jgi:ABC-2 type transport system ATP-binding protein
MNAVSHLLRGRLPYGMILLSMMPTPQIAPIIETRDLSKTYGRFVAVHELNISVPNGSVFALMGANGAGKTTVIKILLNIISPTRGKATVLGVESCAIDPTILAKIGYVSENQVLPLRLRVNDFFEYLRPCYADWDRNLEEEIRGQLALPPYRKIGELSHGMRMKMALACALPFRPKLLVLDEPLSGLDPLARDELIGGFMRQAGETTILISSHELDEVERFATHVGFLHEGRLLFQGSVGALAEHARSLFETEGLQRAERPSLRDIFVAMLRTARKTSRESTLQ